MEELGILNWRNENSLTPYPLTKSIGFDSLILDASFTQFDNFIPILVSLTFQDTKLQIKIRFDTGEIAGEYNYSSLNNKLEFFDNNRPLGYLLINSDISDIVAFNLNKVFVLNVPFLPSVVNSIPSKSGVYAINGKYSSVGFENTSTVRSLYVSDKLTFDAFSIADTTNPNYLKSLNSVTPISNVLKLQESKLVKIVQTASDTLTISLIGNNSTEINTHIIKTTEE